MGLFDKFADIIRENDDDEFDDFYVCYIFAMNMRKLKGLYVALWGLLMAPHKS